MNRTQSLVLAMSMALFLVLLATLALAQTAVASPAVWQASIPAPTSGVTATPPVTGTAALPTNPPQIVLQVDSTSLNAGECTVLRWAAAYVDSFCAKWSPARPESWDCSGVPQPNIHVHIVRQGWRAGDRPTSDGPCDPDGRGDAGADGSADCLSFHQIESLGDRVLDAGTKLRLIEEKRAPGKVSTGIFYRLVADGLDPAKQYELWAYSVAQGKPALLGPVDIEPDGTVVIERIGLGGFTKANPSARRLQVPTPNGGF